MFDAAVSGEAAFLLAPGRGVLALVANYDAGHVERLGVFDEIRAYDRSFGEAFQAWMRELGPTEVLLNYAETDVLCDGLRHGQYLRVARLLGEALPGATLASSEAVLQQVRGVKTGEELARLRVAIQGSVDLYDRLTPLLRVGMSEREVQALMTDLAAQLGFGVHLGDYGGALVCINRVGLAHRAPGDDALEPGDLLILDHALEHQGYHSDLARTVYVPRAGEREAPARGTARLRQRLRGDRCGVRAPCDRAWRGTRSTPPHGRCTSATATPRSRTRPVIRSVATSTTAAPSSGPRGSGTGPRRTAPSELARCSRSSPRSSRRPRRRCWSRRTSSSPTTALRG